MFKVKNFVKDSNYPVLVPEFGTKRNAEDAIKEMVNIFSQVIYREKGFSPKIVNCTGKVFRRIVVDSTIVAEFGIEEVGA